MIRYRSAAALVLLLSLAPVAAKPKTVSNPIYSLYFDGDYKYELVEDQEHNPGMGNTVGKAEYRFTNKTPVPLAVGSIQVEHTCKNTGNPRYAQPMIREYGFGGVVEVGPGETVSGRDLLGRLPYEPCSGEGGGVAGIRVKQVSFSQAHFTPAEQFVQCGERELPIVMVMIGNAKVFRYYTLDGISTYTAGTHAQLSREEFHKEICSVADRTPSTASRLMGGMKTQLKLNLEKFMKFTGLWTEACDAKPDRCREGYNRWTSTGVKD